MTLCPNCGGVVDPRIAAQTGQLTSLVRQVYRDHFGGEPDDAPLCPDCALTLAHAAELRRSATSLHIATEPHTTFPYYHPLEETVLSQAERMAHHPGFSARDVTIGFIDSGFYPHPDLLADSRWEGTLPAWSTLSPAEWRELLRTRPSRLVDYVDLRRDRSDLERYGLDAPGLWDDHWLSWHGEMTSVIAAGNGLLSGGRYRGLAPEAQVLAIAVGDGSGRIPETDILAGLEWLLTDDRWERYGVRVLNLSVGGDYPQHWTENAVSLAADELSRRGVLVLAASGNSGVETLLPPAQTPSVLTVGGYDDLNRRWSTDGDVPLLDLYHHNHGLVDSEFGLEIKPDLLAPARYVPSPILPPSWVLRETHAIGGLRRTLNGDDPDQLQRLLAHWHRVMHVEEARAEIAHLAGAHAGESGMAATLQSGRDEIRRALRKRMNAHKWVHPYYQHADGTSVAVAQVSAVAAQMAQANSHLSGAQIRTLLLATAWPYPHWRTEDQGRGLLQPAAAVAAALRAPGGILAGLPVSGTIAHDSRLRKWLFQGTLTRRNLVDFAGSGRTDYVYVGLYAPDATGVSLIGSFNEWDVDQLPLERTPVGWWHGAVRLPPGEHVYRFWLRDHDTPDGRWVFDPENSRRTASGYTEPHTVLRVEK